MRDDIFAPLIMSRQLSRELMQSFPKIVGSSHRHDLFSCGDGWHGILLRGMGEIQSFCDLCSEDSPDPVQVVLEQVQERDGTLKFFYRVDGAGEFEREIIDGIAMAMESASLCFCEITGASPACLCRRGPRLRTLCYEAAVREGYEPWSTSHAPSSPEITPNSQAPDDPSAEVKECHDTGDTRDRRDRRTRRSSARHRTHRGGRGDSPAYPVRGEGATAPHWESGSGNVSALRGSA